MKRALGVMLLLSAVVVPPAANAAGTAATRDAPTPATETTTDAPVARDVLFGNPERTQPRISPNGRWVSFLAPDEGVMNVWLAPRGTPRAARPVTRDRGRGVHVHHWAKNGRQLLYLQDSGGNENFHLYAVGVDGGEPVNLTPIDGVRANLVSLSPRRPDHAVVGVNDRDRRYHDLYEIDLRDGSRRLLERNELGFSRFVVDLDHRVRLGLRPRAGNDLEVQRRDASGWTPLLTILAEDTENSRPVGVTPNGQGFYLLDSTGRDLAALTEVEFATGRRRTLASSDLADVAGTWLHPRTGRADAFLVNHLRPEWTALDRAVAADVRFLQQRLEGAFQVPSRSDDDRYWIVAEIRSTAPTRHHLYDRRERTLELLFAEQPALETAGLPPSEPVVIRARDGLPLVSYLTLPHAAGTVDEAGRPARPVPLVLLVHGGPWARDSYGYSAEAQWLADRGYAVLRVNFRGSTGFGKNFVNAGDLEWGEAMHDDLLDAADWAVARGITTPDRVAIMGGSYGGYAALAGLAFTPTRFACGISIVGPSNLNTLLASIPPYWETMRELFARRVGDPRTPEGRELLAARSPLHRAGDIVRPLLIGQGANDPRVVRAESDQIVEAMSTRRIPVTYAVYPDEGHGFLRAPNRISFYAIAEAFLGRCLGGRVEPIGTALEGSTVEVPTGAELIDGLSEALAGMRAGIGPR